MLILGCPAKMSDLFPERSTSSQLPLLPGKADQTLVGCISSSMSPNTQGQTRRKPFLQGISIHLFPAKIRFPTCTAVSCPESRGPQCTFGLTLGSARSTITYDQLLSGASLWSLMHWCTMRKMKNGKVLRTKFRELFNSDSMSLLIFFWSTSSFFPLPFFENLAIADFQKMSLVGKIKLAIPGWLPPPLGEILPPRKIRILV